MKSGHKCEIMEKGPQGRDGENLQFFLALDFSKTLRKWSKSS